MTTTKTRKPLAERLRSGLQEVLSHAKGELTLRTTEHPLPPPNISSEVLVEIRQTAAMSQAIFAKLLSTSPKTVQSWEQGKRVPSMATRRLIELFVTEPETVCRVVGLPEVKLSGFKITSTPDKQRTLVKETV